MGLTKKCLPIKKIELVLKKNDEQVNLLKTHIHSRTKEATISFKTDIISKACGLLCGFEEYNSLLSNKKLERIGLEYEQFLLKNESVWFDKRKFLELSVQFEKQAQKLYSTLVERNPKLSKVKSLDAMGLISHGYSTTIFQGYEDRASIFRKLATPKIGEFKSGLKALPREEYKAERKLLKPFEKKMSAAFSDRQSWSERTQRLQNLATEMAQSPNSWIVRYSKIIRSTLKEVDNEYQAFLAKDEVYFHELANESMSKELILTHMFRLAFYFAEDKEKAHTLLSKKLKKEIIEGSEKDGSANFSIKNFFRRYMISARYILPENDSYLFNKSAHEYKLSAKRDNNVISLSNELDNFTVIFENGAWRLDSFDFKFKR